MKITMVYEIEIPEPESNVAIALNSIFYMTHTPDEIRQFESDDTYRDRYYATRLIDEWHANGGYDNDVITSTMTISD